MRKLYLIVFLIGFHSCKQKSNVCEIKSLKILGTHEIVLDIGTGVEHYILMKDFPRSCLDSTLLVNAASNYADTVGKSSHEIAMPANILRFYSSDEDFVLNNAPPDDKQLNKSCLIAIILDNLHKPIKYIFYNDKGNVIYSGNKWLK